MKTIILLIASCLTITALRAELTVLPVRAVINEVPHSVTIYSVTSPKDGATVSSVAVVISDADAKGHTLIVSGPADTTVYSSDRPPAKAEQEKMMSVSIDGRIILIEGTQVLFLQKRKDSQIVVCSLPCSAAVLSLDAVLQRLKESYGAAIRLKERTEQSGSRGCD